MTQFMTPEAFMVQTHPNPSEGPQADEVNFDDFVATIRDNPEAPVYVENGIAYVEVT